MGPDQKDAADSERPPAPPPPSGRVTSYSHVGRRSSAGMQAVAVSVEKMPAAEKITPSARPLPPPLPPSSSRKIETDDHPVISPSSWPAAAEGPPTEKHARPPPSQRPAAPEPFSADAEVESIAQTFDRLLASDVEAGFAAMAAPASSDPSPVSSKQGPQSLEEVRSLFAQLAAHHARPVRDFLIDLRWGEASRDWVAVCVPAVQALRRAADKLELAELIVALDAFETAMNEAAAEPSPMIEGPARDRLLELHDALTELLPAAFALDMDRSQRETVIVQSILVQVPEVRKVTLDRLYAAGLNTIGAYVGANAGDLSATTGISLKIATQIVDAFRAFKDDLHASSPDATRTRERARVLILLGELEALHAAFERASSAWTPDATEEKKRTRRARNATLMQINVILARLGEVARLREIERYPFERKLEAIRNWLREAQSAAEHPTI